MNRAMLGPVVMHAGAGQLPPGTALIAVAEDLAAASAALAAGADLIDLGPAPAEMIAAFRADHPGILVCAAGSPADVVREAAVARATGALLVCADAETAAASGLPADRILVEVLPAQVPRASQAGLAALVDADRAADLAARSDLSHRDTAAGTARRAGAAPRPAGPRGPNDPADPRGPGHDPADTRGPGHDPADTRGPGHDPADTRGPGHDPADADHGAVAGLVAIAAVSSWLGARAVRTRHPVQVRRALDMTASIRGIRPPARTIRGLA
jgi:hypothetical protein